LSGRCRKVASTQGFVLEDVGAIASLRLKRANEDLTALDKLPDPRHPAGSTGATESLVTTACPRVANAPATHSGLARGGRRASERVPLGSTSVTTPGGRDLRYAAFHMVEVIGQRPDQIEDVTVQFLRAASAR
jgi:hypothetical protein